MIQIKILKIYNCVCVCVCACVRVCVCYDCGCVRMYMYGDMYVCKDAFSLYHINKSTVYRNMAEILIEAPCYFAIINSAYYPSS